MSSRRRNFLLQGSAGVEFSTTDFRKPLRSDCYAADPGLLCTSFEKYYSSNIEETQWEWELQASLPTKPLKK